MKKLLFIPPDYDKNTELPLFNALGKYFDCSYYTNRDAALQFNPDFIYVQSGAIDPVILKTIKHRCNSFLFQWTGDCRLEPLPEIVALKGIADLTLLAQGIGQKRMYEEILEHPVKYLQHFVSDWQRREVTPTPNDKIVFIANRHTEFEGAVERNYLCETLSKKYKNFEVYGSGYNMPEYNNKNSIPYVDSHKIYNEAYISISASSFNHIPGYWSNRPLNIMAAGGCCLFRYAPGATNYFTHMEDVVYYMSEEECISQIDYLFKHPEVRNRIAAQGQKKVFEEHNDRYRAQQIFNFLTPTK